MGACGGKSIQKKTPESIENKEFPKISQSQNESPNKQPSYSNYSQIYQNEGELTSTSGFNFTTSNFVQEKFGKINKDYTLLNPPLGKGAFGEVRKAIHKPTGIHRAIKLMNKANISPDEQEKLINEVQILKKLDHPNIIKVLEFYQDDHYFYIVQELCTGGELFDKIINEKFFSEKKAAIIMRQVISAIFYCHQNKIVHRDLKPENLLFETSREGAPLKVIDFGTSRLFEPSHKMDQKFGTPYYIAPEVLKRKYDEKCDIWSCGVILYIMLCGQPPFNGSNDKVIMDKVSKGVYGFQSPEWKQVSQEAISFIKKMLEYDPQKRLTAEQAIADPWIKKYVEENAVEKPLMKKALENMQTFRANQKLQEASFMFLVQYFTTREEKSQLIKKFQAIDTNGDGVLSRDELIEAYKQFKSEEEAIAMVNDIMKQIDKNNNGTIDYTGFSKFVMATCNREHMLSKDKLEVAFKMFDKDGSGALDISELKEVFSGADVSDEVWNELVKEVDENNDGQIQLSEFKQMMMKLIDNEDKKSSKK